MEQKFKAAVEFSPSKAKPITKEKIMEYDLKAAGQWVCTAELYLAKNSDFGERWGMATAEKTDFWSGELGMSKER